MVADVPYKNLKHTLLSLKIQVEDSLPYISKYIPKHIASPEELFYFLKDLTTYKKDPKNVELLQTVQTLMKRGGKGDCDCFTILVLTACHYLGFKPQQVILVGKTKYSPSHIYSMVYDESKKKMVSMDLTNPNFDTERPYNYRQTLPFMMSLRLEDNYYPLASKASRKAKKETKKVKKVTKQETKKVKKVAKGVKKQNKAKKKIVRSDQSLKRVTSRQTGRTERGDETRLKKLTGKQVKTGKKVKKLIRVKGKQEIIKARQDETLNRIANRQAQEANDHEFNPGSDQAFMPGEEQAPGSEWQAEEADDDTIDTDFELMPDDEQEMFVPEGDEEGLPDYEEEELNEGGLSFFPGAFALINKVGGKIKKTAAAVKASKAGGAVQKGVSKYDEITSLKRANTSLKSELEAEKKNKYIYGGAGTGLGFIAGVLAGRATK